MPIEKRVAKNTRLRNDSHSHVLRVSSGEAGSVDCTTGSSTGKKCSSLKPQIRKGSRAKDISAATQNTRLLELMGIVLDSTVMGTNEQKMVISGPAIDPINPNIGNIANACCLEKMRKRKKMSK